ncbi:MarR family winged helix-turn-helix transcriptional regulator [Kribbella sp. CA-293567]|uniref:MarR family winged helix-turn-helix transcriptional regulator n=1 Tax=Kribbella sp. CA-293567 TaxID=3002436 RepID=UPI0022DDC11A|nr:MarR family transcriptional regulator [Kribbella sp. CA-293567]WBQ04966.1 MarR family transcriptional regulator [Kribbella sp. CA-293567]
MATGEEAGPSELSGMPSWLLTQSALHAQRIVAERFAAGNARGYHYRLLATLSEYGPASQASLGRRTGIDRSDVVAAINELADLGYVVRSPDPADGRRNIITLTPAGEQQRERLETLVRAAQDELFAPLTPSERDQLTTLLTKVLRHHQH